LSFEGVVVAIGYYYYDDMTKSIEKMSNKRKMGEYMKSILSTGRVVEWKVGPDLEENVIQATFALHAFLGFKSFIYS